MKSTNRVETVITGIRRGKNSAYGNPGWIIDTEAGEFRMQTNAALGYSLENYSNARFTESYVVGNPARPLVTLLATPAGRVWGIEYRGEILH
jgi:hypothetical protein